MKVRTEGQLVDIVDAELIWRKKELTEFRFILEGSSARRDRKAALLRSAIPILYAHWEGFIKTTGTVYLEFVAAQRLRFDELAPQFVAMAARKMMAGATGSGIHGYVELARFFISGLSQPSVLPYRDGIKARSNLSSEVLKDILVTLGFDFSPYETKTHLIDDVLLHLRNTIAHGEYIQITEDRYEELSREVVEMMEIFRTQVQNAAVLKQFALP